MLELCPLVFGIVRVHASSTAIEALQRTLESASVLRLSPKEALLLCGADEERQLLDAVTAQVDLTASSGVAVTDSDSFAAWTLKGIDADSAFARLSAIRLPTERPAFIQGLVADVPAKVVVEHGRLLLLVGSPVSHHLRERMLESCASMGIVERAPASHSQPLEVVP